MAKRHQRSGGLTFKPLSGGWYRCNQTKEKTKNPSAYAFTYAKAEENKKRQQEIKELPKVTICSDGRWICPNCYTRHYQALQNHVITCDVCKKKYVAVL